MILSALNDYYQRLAAQGKVPQPGFSSEKISFALVFSREGRPLQIDDLRDTSAKKPRPRSLQVPVDKRRTSGIHAYPLWDKTAYALGATAGEGKRLNEEHKAFRVRQHELLEGAEAAELCAFLALIEQWRPEHLQTLSGYSEEVLDSNIVFRLDGEHRFLHDHPEARRRWSEALEDGDGDVVGQCLVTGELAPLGTDHPAIRNINGAQSSGASLISFNSDAYESHGHKGQSNAAISKTAIFGYATALNYLSRRDADNRQRLQFGDTTVLFWARANDTAQAEAAEHVFAVLNDPPTDEQEAARLQTALARIAAGAALADTELGLAGDTQFFVLGLAPNAARLSVRFWYVDTLEQLMRHAAFHQQDLSLDPSPWRGVLPPIWRLLYATAPSRDGRAKAEDIPPQLAGEMARAIFTGRRYPQSLLGNIVMRLRNDGDISGVRVALCKAVLARNARLASRLSSQEVPVSLDPNVTHPGYLLGRLFAELESAQREALGKEINATIRDRYYGAASATPANVFPMLTRNVVHHFARIRKDRRENVAYSIEKRIGEIMQKLPVQFPKNLSLQDQGQFAIGYYQQKWTRRSSHEDTATEGESS
ncbi:type I-C CRISPR-associated protein Cas8c/Csd1 [Kushneria aurantia]|uniref:Type I-C CRISPR-associated protein Cas8c/Csd1 n=1 Tax=Kushneria aurantia TaxID=504092 RepID=A0ABV6G6J8_9GAMM|nr:type I-C CRISPR-associated protein Cas8c/Csd1 [Kushneria aurantia]